ncbi:MAG: hypothetical protein H8D87_14445 [Deltaproteobacteria bacterium]|uniref:hypothetical protein n=1 Tax=Desulfobacula sp. TaxID=2593537 RepID=UPI0019C966DE|nr:hypothetical protein [Candidatus Desulfobacula maris]MBL6993647.1 hypothetical protein [Desulfobacula sp.]
MLSYAKLLETIDINITGDNTIWFEDTAENKEIKMMTEFDGSLLISEHNYDYPVLIYGVTRKDIDCNIQNALELKESHTPREGRIRIKNHHFVYSSTCRSPSAISIKSSISSSAFEGMVNAIIKREIRIV